MLSTDGLTDKEVVKVYSNLGHGPITQGQLLRALYDIEDSLTRKMFRSIFLGEVSPEEAQQIGSEDDTTLLGPLSEDVLLEYLEEDMGAVLARESEYELLCRLSRDSTSVLMTLMLETRKEADVWGFLQA